MLGHVIRETGSDYIKGFKSVVLQCGSNEPNIQIKLILNQKYCMNKIRVIRTFLGSGSLDPHIRVLPPVFDPNIGTLLVMKICKRHIHHVIVAWQTKFNLLTCSAYANMEV